MGVSVSLHMRMSGWGNWGLPKGRGRALMRTSNQERVKICTVMLGLIGEAIMCFLISLLVMLRLGQLGFAPISLDVGTRKVINTQVSDTKVLGIPQLTGVGRDQGLMLLQEQAAVSSPPGKQNKMRALGRERGTYLDLMRDFLAVNT